MYSISHWTWGFSCSIVMLVFAGVLFHFVCANLYHGPTLTVGATFSFLGPGMDSFKWWCPGTQCPWRQGGKSMASNTWCRTPAAECCWGTMVFFVLVWRQKRFPKNPAFVLETIHPSLFSQIVYSICLFLSWVFSIACVGSWLKQVFSIWKCFFHGSQSFSCLPLASECIRQVGFCWGGRHL